MRTALLLGLALAAGAAEPAIAIRSTQPGNVFAEAGGTVAVAAAATGAALLEDEAGRELARAAVAPGAPAALALPGPGWYRVRAEAGGASASSAALVLGEPPAAAALARSPVGFFSVNTANPLAARAGGRWNRAFVDLTSVRADGERFAWARRSGAEHEWLTLDGLELPADQEWILCLGRIPDAWTTKPSPVPREERWKFYPPRDWARFAAFMRWVAGGLPAAVRHVEVLNEPDANWRGSEEELVRYHLLAAEAVHAVRPDVQVLGPCLCSVKIDQLARLERLGLFDRLDGLSLHPYVNGTPPEHDFIAKIDELRAWNAARTRPLPLYFTEFGWQTSAHDWQSPVDERTHARYTARSLLLLAARPEVRAAQLFCLLNARPGSWDAYSLLAADGSPRLAYAYAATAMHRLAGAAGARELALGGEARALAWGAGGAAMLALWTGGAGEPAALALPAGADAAWGAAGRRLPPPAGAATAAGDPLYLRLPGCDPAARPALPALTVLAGSGAALPCDAVLAAADLVERTAAGGWRVRADAPRGSWRIAGRTAGGWAELPLTVTEPVAAEGVLTWRGLAPWWRVELVSHLPVEARVEVALTVAGAGGPRPASATVPAGGRSAVELPLAGLPWGHRLGGELELAVGGAAPPWRERSRWQATIAAIPAAPADEAGWARLPAMEFTGWAPFAGAGQPATARPGLRGRLRLGHGAAGLHLRAEVDDPEHRQEQPPAAMWREDSLQLAFDADIDRPWEPNSGKWWNGHRIAEYGLSLGAEGPRCWRWGARNGLAADSAEPRVALAVERAGATTRYRALIPWAVLGLDAPLTAGRSLGLALAVNDGGPAGGQRGGLRLFNGIVGSKHPTLFGRLALLP